MKRLIILTIAMMISGISFGKVDLVTLPNRDATEITIYNSADLTLVRDSRSLTLKEGRNKLQFSWANTLIDPTSLDMTPKAKIDRIDIADLTYPPRVKNLGIWNIESGFGGKVPVEISYLTSGLSWRAFYMGTLSEDESVMRLQGYVRVTNNSGEDYDNAKTRLIVGKVHILDRIAELARREQPYGRPGQLRQAGRGGSAHGMPGMMPASAPRKLMAGIVMEDSFGIKEVKKEGLSEYFLYTIEGTESIPTGSSKRLPSFDIDDVPVINLYKHEGPGRGNAVYRYLSFVNDEEHELGETPIPGGMIKVYRNVDSDAHLSYAGQSSFKYIPVNEDVELNLGAVSDVIVEPKLMNYATANYQYDRKDNINGWDEIRTIRITIKNTRDLPIKIELKRNFNTTYWKLDNKGDHGKFEKIDMDTVKYTHELLPRSERTFEYTMTTYHGDRQDVWIKTNK